MKWIYNFICISIIFVFQYTELIAHSNQQVITKHIVINKLDTNRTYTFKEVLAENYTPNIEVTNVQTIIANDTHHLDIATLLHDVTVDFLIAKERKQAYILGQIPTYIKTQQGIAKVISCDIIINLYKTNTPKSKKVYAANSVLSSGNWYKIGVNQKGVYKIDYNGLNAIGINPSSIDARNIRIYGNGGQAMNEAVDTNFIDDLAENAIFVSTSSATFGPNDYILFYSNGLVATNFVDETKATHITNPYENQAYYFITVDKGVGKRIHTESNAAGSPAVIFDSYHEYKLLDLDSASLSNIGKVWWGSRMNALNPATLNPTFSFNLGNPISDIKITSVVANTSSSSANFSMYVGNQLIQSKNLNALTNLDNFYSFDTLSGLYSSSLSNLTVKLNYSLNGGTTGSGYIDFISLYYENTLAPYESQLIFKNANAKTYASNDVIQYNLKNGGDWQIWNITDPLSPVKINGNIVGKDVEIKQENSHFNEYIAFLNTFHTPQALGQVPNQNLHALDIPDLLIITDNNLKPAAEALAQYRTTKNGFKVHVVEKQMIYNEFGSGKQDIGAIRNFVKMFYDRAASTSDIPKGVLFFGAASFDYKDKIANNTNIVPTYQSEYSHVKFSAFSSDDYFTLLDEGENFATTNSINSNLLDIAIGRIPVMNVEQGFDAVNKIKLYESPEGFGSWKSNQTSVADDIDENGAMNHLDDIDEVNKVILEDHKNFNLFKVYSDAYKKVATASGLRYPSVNKAISDQIFNGTLFVAYFGHGSPERWADEAILTNDDIKSWNNTNKLPLFFTGTCDFGRYDNPQEISAGVNIFNKKQGGAIGLITTTQVVFANSNKNFSKSFFNYQFTKDANNEYRSIGEALRIAKNDNTTGASFSNNKMYVLLGDPTMHLAIPNNIVTTSKISQILEDGSLVTTDTLKALGKYEIEGLVATKDGSLISNYNGKVEVAIYDKVKTIETVNTHPQATKTYKQQTNVIAKVVVDVVDGKFKAVFVVPKDIMLDIGKSKIIYYAWNNEVDALGLDTAIYLGGMSDNYVEDNEGPIVKAYIDDNKFRNGGITGPNPLLYVELYDDNGINISGSSVGHDLVAIVDENLQAPFIMNNFYQTYPNQFQSGYVYFPFSNLADGPHTIRVKAWDTYNNSGEGSVNFQVKNVDDGVINTLYTYPNPFTEGTTIVFQHNQKGKEMSVDVSIFTVTGSLIQRIQKNIQPEENRSEIIWDGKDMNNAPLHPGVYVYRLTIITEYGVKAVASEKLVKIEH